MIILSHARAKKKKGLRIRNLHRYWLFSSDIMAVKGLITTWSKNTALLKALNKMENKKQNKKRIEHTPETGFVDFHFSPFNCCLTVVLSLEKRGLPQIRIMCPNTTLNFLMTLTSSCNSNDRFFLSLHVQVLWRSVGAFPCHPT